MHQDEGHVPSHAKSAPPARVLVSGALTTTATTHSALGWPGEVDPEVDTVSMGLRKFNLGTVPASVTPPRTWRHAAWFSVIASGGALAGLVFLSATLTGMPTMSQHIDALPALPSAAPTIPQPDSSNHPQSSHRHAADHTRPSHNLTGTTRPVSVLADGSLVTTITGGDGRPIVITVAPTTILGPTSVGAAPGQGSGTANPSRPPSTGSSGAPRTVVRAPVAPQPSPTVTSVPPDWRHFFGPRANGPKMVTNSVAFAENAPTDPAAAYATTTGRLHAQGEKALQQRYADVSHIQVKKITVDTNNAKTTNVMRVTYKSGEVATVQRTFSFSPGANPKIEDDGQ
ncbi:MAG: hypothetical protein ACRDTS_22250 [Mycobacterium sp.]